MSRITRYIRSTHFYSVFKTLTKPFDARDICMTKTPDGWMATYAGDLAIGASIRNTGRFEENDIASVIALLQLKPIEKTFIDIGANIGTHSLYALRQGFARCVCIEPDADNFLLLKVNQALNGVEGSCINLNCAVASQTGTAILAHNPVNFGDHRLVAAAHGQLEAKTAGQTIVPTLSFDGLFEAAKINPSSVGLIWIDTQGYEGDVLENASLLKHHAIPAVIEFWPYGLAQSGGYSKLRHFLATGVDLQFVRLGDGVGSNCTIEMLDQYYEAHRFNVNKHTDVLIRPL